MVVYHFTANVLLSHINKKKERRELYIGNRQQKDGIYFRSLN